MFLTHDEWRKGCGRLPGGGVIFTEHNVDRSWGIGQGVPGRSHMHLCSEAREKWGTPRQCTWFPMAGARLQGCVRTQGTRLGSHNEGIYLSHPVLSCKMKTFLLVLHWWMRKRVKQALKKKNPTLV